MNQLDLESSSEMIQTKIMNYPELLALSFVRFLFVYPFLVQLGDCMAASRSQNMGNFRVLLITVSYPSGKN
jgi:hypothetical protein